MGTRIILSDTSRQYYTNMSWSDSDSTYIIKINRCFTETNVTASKVEYNFVLSTPTHKFIWRVNTVSFIISVFAQSSLPVIVVRDYQLYTPAPVKDVHCAKQWKVIVFVDEIVVIKAMGTLGLYERHFRKISNVASKRLKRAKKKADNAEYSSWL